MGTKCSKKKDISDTKMDTKLDNNNSILVTSTPSIPIKKKDDMIFTTTETPIPIKRTRFESCPRPSKLTRSEYYSTKIHTSHSYPPRRLIRQKRKFYMLNKKIMDISHTLPIQNSLSFIPPELFKINIDSSFQPCKNESYNEHLQRYRNYVLDNTKTFEMTYRIPDNNLWPIEITCDITGGTTPKITNVKSVPYVAHRDPDCKIDMDFVNNVIKSAINDIIDLDKPGYLRLLEKPPKQKLLM